MKKFGLVIIGAHIGVHIQSELKEYVDKNVLLVEPVPHNIGILKQNTEKYKKINIEPIAISSKKEIKKFYFVKGDSVHKLGKHWASGIGSFNKQHILDHRTKRFQVEEIDVDYIEVESLTFSDLIKKYEISSIEKLQIDVEGHEYEILNSIKFNEISIDKIVFESKHFDGTFKEGIKLEKIKNKLINNKYKIIQLDKENILAKKN